MTDELHTMRIGPVDQRTGLATTTCNKCGWSESSNAVHMLGRTGRAHVKAANAYDAKQAAKAEAKAAKVHMIHRPL
jgi:hypothetical protein